MSRPRPARVAQVKPGSLAEKVGIASGDILLRLNGRRPRDYIEYRYLAAEARVALALRGSTGLRRFQLEKEPDEDLGLRFAEDVFDGTRTCRNRCPFCFVSQLPKGLRPALYVKDDDYRLSFLHGNFITLTNLTSADRKRIVRLHLSPLYVSVHASEPEVRAQLFGQKADDALKQMRWLITRGIEFHAQIVVWPGVNDGTHLAVTVHDLAELHPGVRSIGVVPVGLTRHRAGLPKVRPVSARLAARIVQQVEQWQHQFLRQLGARLVFAADELYLLAGRGLPSRAKYEDFYQLGNGIGGVRRFLDELARLRPVSPRNSVRATLVTGTAASPLIKLLAEKLERGGRVKASVVAVQNRLLGRTVTTAGLLAGGDIFRALHSRSVGDLILVPADAVREGEGFLDGVTVEQLSRRIGAPVVAAGSPRQAAAALKQFDRGRKRTWAKRETAE